MIEPHGERGGRILDPDDAIAVGEPVGSIVTVGLPEGFDEEWEPKDLAPIEIIDGQHRLFAFNDDDSDDFELPVVAFKGLDLSWQAYLFWTVNIKPKRINASLAFDLYPLLREQDWLDAGEGIHVYRETRAQELTEALWATPESPWFRRINMLGESGLRSRQPVTQAAFVRALTQTFVRAWHTPRTTVGGLFGGGEFDGQGGLDWPRVQQAAYLVACWRAMDDAVADCDESWATELRDLQAEGDLDSVADPAFASPYSMLASDQGVRPLMGLFNDLSYAATQALKLRQWRVGQVVDDLNPDEVSRIVEEFSEQPASSFLTKIAEGLATYDWRSSKAPGLDDDIRGRKLAFRGSSGYKELRRQLLDHLYEEAEDDTLIGAIEHVRDRT
ncbi:DGQHR domain-containing protein [Nocardioides sp. SYSU D00038]|uniref:DGQHR domain-containing protein n=1 Tax=Nocardioides sp. SYSU D00038 TaxID=2812554 RepID=UPI0035B1D8F0